MNINLNVTGMMCEHCEKKVTKALNEINGVSNVVASHIDNKVTLDIIDESLIKEVKKAIKKCGFKIK